MIQGKSDIISLLKFTKNHVYGQGYYFLTFKLYDELQLKNKINVN